MKGTLVLLIFTCISLQTYSQRDFRQGFILTNDMDTIHGLVKYREGSKSFRSCDFKEPVDRNSKSYSPGAIKGYGFEGDKVFVSRNIGAKGQNPDTVFLEVIVKGLVSLYRYEDSFFVEKGETEFYRLDNDDQVAFINGNKFVSKSNRYIGTLTVLMVDCLGMRDQISKVTLHERSLARLIADYNGCLNVPVISYKSKKPWITSSFGISGGVNYSVLKFPYTNLDAYLKGPFSTSRTPMLGLSFDISTPRLNERISFHGDVFFLTSTYHSTTTQITDSSTTNNHVLIELTELKVPLGFRYTFPERNFTPFFDFGFSSTITLKSGSDWIKETQLLNKPVQTEEANALDISKLQLGLWAGIGVDKTISSKVKGFMELRWERTNGISYGWDAGIRSWVTNVQLVLGIRMQHKN